MEPTLADLVAALPQEEQGPYLCQRYKDGLDLRVIMALELLDENGSSYIPDLTALFEYFLLEEGVLTRDRCASFASFFLSGHLPALNGVLIKNHTHYRIHFFLCGAANFFQFLYGFYNSLSLEQVLVIARQISSKVSYSAQIDAYLEDLETLTEKDYTIVAALAEIGNLSLRELADGYPVLFECLKEEV